MVGKKNQKIYLDDDFFLTKNFPADKRESGK
jgi:hypothetical protein